MPIVIEPRLSLTSQREIWAIGYAVVAEQITGEHALVVGHPFIDIWQAVKPDRLGIHRWPHVPKGIDWKTGTCQQLGWPHRDQADIARAWKHVLGRVTSFADLARLMSGVTGRKHVVYLSEGFDSTILSGSVENEEQAWARAEEKGRDAARVAVEVFVTHFAVPLAL